MIHDFPDFEQFLIVKDKIGLINHESLVLNSKLARRI